MNPWHMFLEYAQSHPEVPKDSKLRSKLYQNLKQSCFCGHKEKLCGPLGFASKVKLQNNISQALLDAKLKAYEELLKDKDEYISHLEKMLKKSKAKLATQ